MRRFHLRPTSRPGGEPAGIRQLCITTGSLPLCGILYWRDHIGRKIIPLTRWRGLTLHAVVTQYLDGNDDDDDKIIII